MVPRPLSLLERLPKELIPNVLLCLDSHSLLSLLQAFPGLASQCVVLADEAHFFKCPSLRVLLPHEFVPSRYILKIYEFLVPTTFQPDYSLNIPYASSSDSFIHCFMSTEKLETNASFYREVFKSLLYDSGITFQLDSFRTDRVIIYNDHSNLISADQVVYDNLTHIDLQNISHLEDVSFPASLSYLSVSFVNGDSRPTMRNISAIDLKLLEIYYEDLPPVFEKLKLTVCNAIGGTEDIYDMTLKVCHTPSNRNLTSPLPIPSYSPDLVDFSPLVSRHAFGTVTVIGGHDCIVKQLTRGLVGFLTWKQTCYQSNPIQRVRCELEPGLIKWSCFLIGVSFETLLPNAIIPLFQMLVIFLHITTHNGASFQPQDPALTEVSLDELHGRRHLDYIGYGYYSSLMIHSKLPKFNSFPFELNIPSLDDFPGIDRLKRLENYDQCSFEGLRESTAIREGAVPEEFNKTTTLIEGQETYWNVQKMFKS